jgi:DNA gyrase/topoisomerase IV subunit B
MSKEYSYKDIKVLSELDHIRLNPGLYIGELKNPNHLCFELLDNSLDESIPGYATIVGIVINTQEGTISVLDNGRGIPIENNTIPTIATKLFSGGKFEKSEGGNAYKVACWVGSTLIKTLRGPVSIDELMENPEVHHQIISRQKHNGRNFWKVGYIKKCHLTGYSRIFVKVTLSNGYTEMCTPEQLWRTRNGRWVPAKNLEAGTSLLTYNLSADNYFPTAMTRKVTKIQKMRLKTQLPIYDIIVPFGNSYTLASGALVHNSGLHGIGLVAVTALSEWVSVTVHRNNKKAFYKFTNAKLTEEKITDFTEKAPYSTQITFKPDKKIFESIKFEVDAIRQRMKLASVHIPHLQLLLIVDGQKEVINCDENDYFLQTLLDGKKSENLTSIFDIKKKIKDEELHIKFCWDFEGSSAPKQTGCVNLLKVDQGNHINMVYSSIRDVFEELGKKEKMKFTASDSLVGFRCHTSLMLYKPEYTSQTKEKLATSKEKLNHLFESVQIDIKKILNDNPELKTQLLSSFENYRRRMETGRSIVKTDGVVTRFSTISDSKLRDCTSNSTTQTELFVTEGTSASGSLIQCRDPRYHGVLGLKGKIPNLAMAGKDELKNKEIVEIINALGTGIEPHFNYQGLRYGKCIFACDADGDGCARYDSLIYLKNKNEQILIKELKDLVDNKDYFKDHLILGYNEEDKKFTWTEIIKIWPYKIFSEWIDIILENGQIISLTQDHLVLTNRGYIRADELNQEDIIIDAEEFREIR